MRPNVKDPEVYRLAQAIVRATAETMTHVVTEALRELYAKIEHWKSRATGREPLAIADRVATHLKRPYALRTDRLKTVCKMILDTSAAVAIP